MHPRAKTPRPPQNLETANTMMHHRGAISLQSATPSIPQFMSQIWMYRDIFFE
jgi:hypothetical protein